MTDKQKSAPTEMAGWAEWTDGTQNSAGVLFTVDRINSYIEGLEARITELEAIIAGEPDRMRGMVDALEAIELYASNHGGWFENDAWLWGQSMGAKAKEALAAIRTQETGQ